MSTAAQPPSQPRANRARFDVESQSAGMINNVGENQYLSYVQHIQTERASFLREVAATRTKARWLVWLGLLLTLVGVAAMLLIMSDYIEAFGRIGPNGDSQAFEDLFAAFTQEVAGVSVLLVAAAASTLGQILLVVGIVLHIVATSRRKRVDRELPIPAPPWAPTATRGQR